MHSLFEGVSTHLLNQLFHHLIDDGIITLEEVNSEVKKLCSGYSDVDTMPAPVYRDGRYVMLPWPLKLDKKMQFIYDGWYKFS